MADKTKSIYTRVTPQEKNHIQVKARQCGLSVSEYLRQRALGYAPRAIPSEELHALRRELFDFRRSGISGHADEDVQKLLDEMRDALILPGRDG